MSLKIQQRAVLTAILEGNLTNVFDFLKMHEVVRSMHELLEKIKMRYNFDTDDIYTEFMGSINHAENLASCCYTTADLINNPMDNGNTLVIVAISLGHLEIVKVLIKLGGSVNQGKVDGQTPLSAASLLGYLEIVKVLLAAGGDVNQADLSGETPLHLASIGPSSVEVVKLLIASGALVNKVDNNGNTPLHIAQNDDQSETVEIMQREMNWQRYRPLFLMHLWEDYTENKAHWPTRLGKFLTDKNDQEGQDIKRSIASYL